VSSPLCPTNSTWDEETSACYRPCSSYNTGNVTYTVHADDPAICVPGCASGMAARPGANGYSTQCVQCPAGSTIVAGKKGNWVCRRGGQSTLPKKSITLAYKPRVEVDGGCGAGAVFVNGVCATCTSCDAYLTSAPPEETVPRQYLFWQAEGAVSLIMIFLDILNSIYDHQYFPFVKTFCVPDACCYKESWMIEGGGCADGDCDVAPEDQFAV
jgi:hypothetical protein